MKENNSAQSILFFGGTGCFLLFLIVFNFFFGWIFFSVKVWLVSEIVLIILFRFTAKITTKKVSFIFSNPKNGKKDKIIDIEGEVVDDKKRLH